MPNAIASTDRVNSSREPVRATRARIHGTMRGPRMRAVAAKAPTLASVIASSSRTGRSDAWLMSWGPVAWPPSISAKAGSSTSASTMARSSTISQPTATRPLGLSSRVRSSRAFRSTTVLATERLSPTTRPVPSGQPHSRHRPMPRAVARTIWRMAPGTASRRTASRSAAEKCSPTPNISKMMPTSANCTESSPSATNPGVKGPTRTPASR